MTNFLCVREIASPDALNTSCIELFVMLVMRVQICRSTSADQCADAKDQRNYEP